MIATRLMGGLGNQMFQYAAGRALAAAHSAELVLDTKTGFVRDRLFRRSYALDPFPIRAREAAMKNVRVAVTGTLDGSPERFTGFTVDVSADCSDVDLARKLVTLASRACQVMNTLRLAAPIEISYQGAPIESAEAVA